VPKIPSGQRGFFLVRKLLLKRFSRGGTDMARHKKIERKKELDRRRKRKEKREKQRIKEAKAEARKA